MKHTNKLLAVVMALMIVVACASVTVYADEVPTLPATEDTVLAYVDFDQNMDVDIDDSTDVADGIATMYGNGEIVFDASVLEGVNETLIAEFVIRPEAAPEHGIIFSAGNIPDNCIIIGTRAGNKLKYTSLDSPENVVTIGEWMVVKYVITATHVQIFVDGEIVAEADNKTNFAGAAGDDMKFGMRTVEQWPDPGYTGDVSEIRLSTPKKASSGEGSNDTVTTPETGDVTVPFAVVALLAVAAVGMVVLKKKEVKE